MDPDVGAEVLGHLVEFVEQTTDFVGVADTWGRILYLNPAAQKALGITDYDGLTIADLFPGDSFVGPYYDIVRPQLLRTGAYSGEMLLDVPGAGATPLYVSMTARIGPGGETNGGAVYMHAVTPDAAPQSGSFEHTTAVLARPAFEEQIRIALQASPLDDEVCALVIVKVDHASTVEMIGASAAADVVQALSERMLRLARTIDTVGLLDEQRLGVFLRAVRSKSEVLRVARMIYESLVEPPVATPAGEIPLALAYGVALTEPDDDATRLIERASRATSQAAAAHADPSESRHDVAGSPGDSVSMREFQLALSHGYVRPYAQPVVELGSREVVGYRGVARWHHERLGVLPASAFIDMIADSPLAAQVDFYIARELAAVLTLVTRDTPLHLYAPVSRRLMHDPRVERYLLEIADAFHLTPAQLRLQVPRPMLENATSALLDVLGLLTNAGVGLALTQVECAADVSNFADRGMSEFFISYALTNATDAQTRREISRIVQTAHDRGGTAGATGVFTSEQHDELVAIGCDVATGDFYGPPQAAHEID